MRPDNDWPVAWVVFALMLPVTVLSFRYDPEPRPGGPGAVKCHAAGGWWVAATLDNHGEPKMWACVDDAGRLVRLSEEK